MARYWFRGQVFDSSKPTAQPLPSEDELFRTGMMLRQRDVQWARQNREERRTEMAKKEVPMNEWLDIARQMKDNPAMRARLAEMISAGQVDISVGADGNLRVMADEVGNSPARSSSVTSSLKPMTATPQASGLELARRVAKLADSRDYKLGEERRRSKQELTPAQQAAVSEMRQLEALTAAEKRAEAPKLPGKYSTQPEFASRLVRDLAANPDGFQRVNDARQAISEIRANRNHAAWNERDPGFKNARAEMRMLYDLAYPPESMPVEKLEGSKE